MVHTRDGGEEDEEGEVLVCVVGVRVDVEAVGGGDFVDELGVGEVGGLGVVGGEGEEEGAVGRGQVVHGLGLEGCVLGFGELVEGAVVDHEGGCVGHDLLAASDGRGGDEAHAFAGE